MICCGLWGNEDESKDIFMTYNESPSNESPSGWLQPITRSPDHYLTVIPSLVWCTIASAAVLCDWALSAYLLKVIKIFIVWRIMHLDLNKLQMHSRKLCSVFIYWQAFKGRALLKILSVPSPSIYNHLVLFWSLLLEFHCPNQPSQIHNHWGTFFSEVLYTHSPKNPSWALLY